MYSYNGLVAFNVPYDSESSGTGWFGSVLGGYGKHYTLNTNSMQANFTTRFKMYDSWGVSTIPGYLLNDSTMFYARLGLAEGYLKISSNDISLGKISRHLDGFRWGLGVQQFISTQYALRLEYNTVSYKTSTDTQLDILSNTLKTTKITPHVSEVEFALVYNFC